MINLKRAYKSDRIMKSLTGLTRREFDNLKPTFEKAVKAIKPKRNDRIRAEGGGPKHTLEAVTDKLFYILFYAKCYPTFDLAGFFYDVDRAQPCRWTQHLLKALEKALGYEIVLPERQINSVEEFMKKFPDIKDVFIDGTEREIQRPFNPKRQRRTYSGKAGKNTRKNIVMSDERKKIRFLSKTKSGKMNDKKLLDKTGLMKTIPNNIGKWLDKGFIGVQGVNIMIPTKKPKNGQLTDAQKDENRLIASIRIAIEHAICGIKRYRIVSDAFRNNRIHGMDDKVMYAACGLWNFHLRFTA